jgi:hypothetical protein
MEFISLHKVFGNKKTLITQVGIAWITALNRISFPAWENNFSFHWFILLHIFPLIPVNVLIFERPTKVGRHKYFPYLCVKVTLAKERISSFASYLVLRWKIWMSFFNSTFLPMPSHKIPEASVFCLIQKRLPWRTTNYCPRKIDGLFLYHPWWLEYLLPFLFS